MRYIPRIPANGDVAGIGIRLSIYITTLIISLVPNVRRTEQLRGALMTAAGLNGFSLLIAALIETANRSLTLYHAIVIMHILIFLGIATNPAGPYRATRARLILYLVTTWMILVLLFCWTIYVWVMAPTFGAPGTCNSETIYVLFFVSVRATIGWLRWLFVTAAGVFLFVWVSIPILTIVRMGEENAVVAAPSSRHGSDLEPHRIFSWCGRLGRVLASVYGVTMLELTVHRNKQHVVGDENQWAFGQIVAMLITVGSLNEVVHFFLGEGRGNIFELFCFSSHRSCSRTPEHETSDLE